MMNKQEVTLYMLVMEALVYKYGSEEMIALASIAKSSPELIIEHWPEGSSKLELQVKAHWAETGDYTGCVQMLHANSPEQSVRNIMKTGKDVKAMLQGIPAPKELPKD